MREVITVYFLSFSESLYFNFSDQSESNCNLTAIGSHLDTTSNLGIGILEKRDLTAFIVSSQIDAARSARNPIAISKCITRARRIQPRSHREENRVAPVYGENRADRSIRLFGPAFECAIVEKIYARSSAREEITFIRTNYLSASGIETSVDAVARMRLTLG